MIKTAKFSVATLLLSTSLAFAGDTVTVNMPGGATQTVSSSVLAAMLNKSPSATGDNAVVGVSADAATGGFTITTAGGKTYNVTSQFISTLLTSY